MALADMFSGNGVQTVLIVVAVLLIGYLILNYLNSSSSSNNNSLATMRPTVTTMPVTESFYAGEDASAPTEEYSVNASDGIQENERPKALGDSEGTQLNQLPAECYPKDVLSSADLLPRDADSAWAQVAPSGQGSLQDKNFLTAGFHVGINTVGQTLRNANYQLRSEPPNPQVKVSPWNMTTIDPDTNRRPMEIGGAQ
jgi:hypothetical protein